MRCFQWALMTIKSSIFVCTLNPMNPVSQSRAYLYNLTNVKNIRLFLDREFKLFLGKLFCGLNKEYRFIIPDGYKTHLTDEVIMTQGFDRNLWVLSNSAFQEICKKMGSLNLTDPMTRLLFRLVLGTAVEINVNSDGYLEIPNDLREYAQIENEVFVIGQGDYFEIWSPQLWKQQEAELRKTEENIERFSTLEMTTR